MNRIDEVAVGIVDLDTYVPDRFMPASEISELSGIPESVLVDKFGIKGKHVTRPDEHVSDMCISAARSLLERNDPSEVDAVVYFGSHWKDYMVWQAAPKIQHALGIEGFAMEMVNVSAGAPVGLKAVTDMLRADPHLNSVLMVGAAKESHLLDYSNERSRFMFNFGDGAVAALLRKGETSNQVLASSILTDGSFSDHVRVSGGGSVHPASHDTVDDRMHFLQLYYGEEMKRRLDPITLKYFIKVATESVERSGYLVSDIDMLLPIHMKKSLHDSIAVELGLREDQSIYLDHFGHMSAVDPLFALTLARDAGALNDGDIAVLLAAGTGYSWAATTVRWGPMESSS
ncbi:MAG: 3-oxoacyl-ACP synthase [Actinomycetota bacterium]|nr:3-oxoacyl-ACP synthase [Actinomycetota bacterium]